MQISMPNARWYDKMWAAFAHYTCLPLLRIYRPRRDSGAHVVEYWPLTGWLTATAMAATIYFGSLLLPYAVSVALAMAVRLLLTGAIHERGLCAFVDGLAVAGGDRDRALAAMSGRGAGAAGVVALVAYHLLLFLALYSVDYNVAVFTVLMADPFAKMVASQATLMMPRAVVGRTDEAAPPSGRPSTAAGLGLAAQGLLPLAAYIYYTWGGGHIQYVVFAPCIVMYFLYLLVWSRLRGYTGRVLSAMFLAVELTIYLVVSSFYGAA